jgi:Xaa-Pro aminopeptidase
MLLDPRRRTAIQQAMTQARLDALFVRLGENLLPLTGYWPGLWLSAALIWPNGDSTLICPEMEADRAVKGWASEVLTFRCWRLGDPDPEASLIRLLHEAAAGGLSGGRIGYEGGFDLVGPAYVALEQPAIAPVQVERVLTKALGQVQLVDATAALYAIRAVKTTAELARLRVTAEISAFGLAAFCDNVMAGRTEIEVAAAVEHAVMVQGTGYKGTRVARACAQVTSGPDTDAFWGYPISRPRTIKTGEVVVIELGVMADGFWADVARVRVTGKESPRASIGAMAAAVCEAQDAALAAIRPGVPAAEVDRASHSRLRALGLEPYVTHSLGHGLGFRYHEPTPLLDPASTDVLVEGMVLALEPGVYVPGLAGVRYENNAIVTADGAELLTTFDRALM